MSTGRVYGPWTRPVNTAREHGQCVPSFSFRTTVAETPFELSIVTHMALMKWGLLLVSKLSKDSSVYICLTAGFERRDDNDADILFVS